MWMIILDAMAAVLLVVVAFVVNTHNFRSALLFQILPFLTAIGLAFSATARFMGWPV
jgi:hypothetical protein